MRRTTTPPVSGPPAVRCSSTPAREATHLDAQPKVALRRTALAARRALDTEQRTAATVALAAHARRLPELRRARTVLLYAAAPDEADLSGLVADLHARQVRTLFPRVRDDELELVAVDDLTTLRPGYRGIAEPVGPRVDPAIVDLAFVPGVAFDRAGARLGQGGGHYDRLLAALPDATPRIGVAFSCQVVPRVPVEDHDRPVDVVLTDHGAHRPATGRP
ncbi:5-formyltetrahydrofolate cyclo-ligase [Nitriliruptoraceae bacterium ZYF776]|nr:5-formyltetrahydrofolate cyclo-ligase [Profundirhabdus halotolerans]